MRAKLLVLCAAATVVAACGQSMPGSAGPQQAPNTPSVSASRSSATTLLAPPVPKQLKFELFNNAENICKLLSISQLQKLGLSKPTAKIIPDTGYGIGCDYGNGTGNGFTISVQSTLKAGLSDTYRSRPRMKYWMPTTVQGFPAVVASVDDARKDGTCSMDVGVTDQAVVLISALGDPDPTGSVACKKVQQVAGEFISTLKLQP